MEDVSEDRLLEVLEEALSAPVIEELPLDAEVLVRPTPHLLPDAQSQPPS